MKRRFVDIHHHILYGIDDGAANPQKMYEMLEKAAKDNIGTIVATPHVTPGVKPFEKEKFDRALADAQRYSKEKELGIELYGGCEILYTPQTASFLVDGRIPAMADTDFVLVEFSPDIKLEEMRNSLDRLLGYGYLPIIAHVERYICLSQHPSRAERLKDEMDVFFQVNAASVISNKEMGNRRFVAKLMELDLVDALGTDAHSPNLRAVHMLEAWRRIKREFGAAYANELTDGHLLFGIS